MKLTALSPVFILTLTLLSMPSISASYDDGYAAFRRGDYAEAFKAWKDLAEHGSQSAQYGLGELYSSGHGVASDDQEAAKWYERAAAGGNVLAQYQLGSMYDEGRGLPKNLSKAMKWYRKAAQQGNLSAQISLGLIYRTGRGVPANYIQAIKWLGLAAEQGDALAQYNLGLIYSDDFDAVKKDNFQALVWFILAERGGSEEARKYHAALATTLSRKQIEKAENVAQHWLTAKMQDNAIRCSLAGGTECE